MNIRLLDHEHPSTVRSMCDSGGALVTHVPTRGLPSRGRQPSLTEEVCRTRAPAMASMASIIRPNSRRSDRQCRRSTAKPGGATSKLVKRLSSPVDTTSKQIKRRSSTVHTTNTLVKRRSSPVYTTSKLVKRRSYTQLANKYRGARLLYTQLAN